MSAGSSIAADERIDVAVIGAGVVGLSVARALSLAGREVVVLEAGTSIGQHASSRNSEVIHAGIYYPTGSLKARWCVRGRALLYAYCAARGIAHRRIGKLLVATCEQEVPALRELAARARANGVTDLQWLDAAACARLEPAVRAVAGLFSPSTGIVDSHGLLAALRADAEQAGAALAFRTEVIAGRVDTRGITLECAGETPVMLRCRAVVNAAGLFAPALARSIEGAALPRLPEPHYAKGHYFVLAGRAPFSHLVYPMPSRHGLGVHVTLDLAGQVRFGPDVSWVDGVDYAFDEGRKPAFVACIRHYYPDLDPDRLQPGYTGIRAKIAPASAGPQDFLVQGPRAHGVPGLVHLFGIESPGLTSALALAEAVVDILQPGT